MAPRPTTLITVRKMVSFWSMEKAAPVFLTCMMRNGQLSDGQESPRARLRSMNRLLTWSAITTDAVTRKKESQWVGGRRGAVGGLPAAGASSGTSSLVAAWSRSALEGGA